MTRKSSTYSYAASVKSAVSDELINVYVIRPLAGLVVRALYTTPVTPNQVSVASTAAGIVAAVFYLDGGASSTLVAGLLITLKDILDSADGQLARAKQEYSRLGRFLDSIGDIIVSVAVFCAIGLTLHRSTGEWQWVALSALAFLGTTLRVSYHVFYHTSFLHLQKTYLINRITEEVRAEDRSVERLTLVLQQIFQVLYGWQDRLMVRIDEWSRGTPAGSAAPQWFADRGALRLSGFLGLGTELFLLMVFSVTDSLRQYLLVNTVLLNLLWVVCILYRRFVLAPRLHTR